MGRYRNRGSGRLELNDDAFRQAAKAYPILSPLRELRASLSEMRLSDLAVGADGRNRCLLSPFGSRSGRNQPSNTRFIFGPSVWLRGLIKPPPGYGVAYIDWSQQEFGIAAGLSRDEAMIAAYNSGDPYLAFAKQAGGRPRGCTKESHAAERELFKTCVLGFNTAWAKKPLALRLDGMTPYPCATAKNLLRSHRETYKTFWRWSDNATDHALLKGWIQTVFGWHIYTSQDLNLRSIRNFPMQANGAEMMRIAACLGTEAGIEICAPVHDAFLIAAPLDRLDKDIKHMQAIMARASKIVIGGLERELTPRKMAIFRPSFATRTDTWTSAARSCGVASWTCSRSLQVTNKEPENFDLDGLVIPELFWRPSERPEQLRQRQSQFQLRNQKEYGQPQVSQ